MRCRELSYEEADLVADLDAIVDSYLYTLFKIEEFEVKFKILRSLRLAMERLLERLGLREKPLLDNFEAGIPSSIRAIYHTISKKLFDVNAVKLIISSKRGRVLQVTSGEEIKEVKLEKGRAEELEKLILSFNKYAYRVQETKKSKTYELLHPKLVEEALRIICAS